LEFRLKNYTEVDQDSTNPYTSKYLKEAYQQGAEAIGWKNRHSPGSDSGTKKTGMGMATQIWYGGGGPPAYAILKLNRDGSVRVMPGTQDIGGGTYTFVAMVASEVLEIPVENIQVILGDTGVCPYGPISGGSLTAPSISPAVRDAAEKMKAKLLSGAAAILELPEQELQYKEGTFTSRKDSSKTINISRIMRGLREQVLVSVGARNPNPDGYAINSFGAQFAQVEVDTETGKIAVKKVVAAHDIGRVLNRKTLENQFHGGVIQGLSFALLEERVMDQYTGKVLTNNMHDYKVPTVMDIPEIEVISVNPGDPMISNTGVKGCGEPAMIPTPGAIANAVYNALGIRMKSLPITPDKVLMALHGESQQG
jgi:xanthine dehydrogenase YagR molybdenum-binding subunit